MSDEPKARRITVNIGVLSGAAVLLVSLVSLYGSWTSTHAKSVTDQLQDDSSAARSLRAVTWIDRNGWRFERQHRDSTSQERNQR